jgi:hypothetical protein
MIDEPDTDFVILNELDTSIQPYGHQMPVVDLTLEGEQLQEILQNTTIKQEYESVNSSQETSNRSTPSCSNNTQIGSDSSSGYDTPLSSTFSKDLISQAIHPLNNLDLGAIEVVDLTDSNNVPQRSTYISEASKSTY